MKVKLQVSSDDIENGVPDCNTDCPIARTVKSVIKHKHRRTVRAYSDYLKFTRMIKRIEYPSSVKRFIDRFDAGKSVKPFSFSLDLPERYLKTT